MQCPRGPPSPPMGLHLEVQSLLHSFTSCRCPSSASWDQDCIRLLRAGCCTPSTRPSCGHLHYCSVPQFPQLHRWLAIIGLLQGVNQLTPKALRALPRTWEIFRINKYYYFLVVPSRVLGFALLPSCRSHSLTQGFAHSLSGLRRPHLVGLRGHCVRPKRKELGGVTGT